MVGLEAQGRGIIDGVIQITVRVTLVIAVVVTVGQRLCCLVKDGIYLPLLREVAGSLRATVQTGVGRICDSIAPCRAAAAHQLVTGSEHERGCCCRAAPVFRAVDGRQLRAAAEHTRHVRYAADVERAEVERLE